MVNGIHYYDVGVTGDGMRGPEEPQYAAENNPYSQWTAHYNEPELWDGNRLISGGKHYGHLEVAGEIERGRWIIIPTGR